MQKPSANPPIEPDTPAPKDPIHRPHQPDQPFHDEPGEEIETDDDEDTGAEPWWM